MKRAGIAAVVMLLMGLAIAQDVGVPAAGQARDLLSVAQADRSLAMFVTAVQSSGMAKMLRDEGPLTVFALSNRAFANLPREDREALLTNHAAMHILLAHYMIHGSIASDDAADLRSARTLVGVKLRTDIRSEGFYVNGAKLGQTDIRCANGAIHMLDSFDPGLVRDAIAMSRMDQREK
jgi:transforming growth factor-beta-induced protein